MISAGCPGKSPIEYPFSILLKIIVVRSCLKGKYVTAICGYGQAKVNLLTLKGSVAVSIERVYDLAVLIPSDCDAF